MTLPIPPGLAEKSLTELLALIYVGKLTKNALKWAEKRIRELWEKQEYGFTPEPKLASDLQRISESEPYRRMKDCIGDHPLLSVVRVGLSIAELSDEGRVNTIAKIKTDVYGKSGIKGVRILSMGGTGVLLEVIQFLSQQKIEYNYNQADMATNFDKLIDKWTEITIFHKTDHEQTRLKNTIVAHMQISQELFFVFASGMAGDQAKKVIARLSNESEIRKSGYRFHLGERKEDRTGRVLFNWVFQKVS